MKKQLHLCENLRFVTAEVRLKKSHEKTLVDSLSEPYYNSARSVPAEVCWDNILFEKLSAGQS